MDIPTKLWQIFRVSSLCAEPWKKINGNVPANSRICLSLLNKVPQVPRVPKCLIAQVPKCLECPSALQMSECFKCPSAQVPWVPKCLSAIRVPKCLRCPECPSTLRVPQKCLSKSVSHSSIHSAGWQCWFSKLISTLRAHTLRKNLILRLRKLDLISNSSLIKFKSLNNYEIYIDIVPQICFQEISRGFFKV